MKKPGVLIQPIVHYGSKSILPAIVGLLIICFLPIQKLQAQGDLLITPRRVVFEGQKRSQELNLANTGKDTAKYNVSIVEYRMNEDGSFTQITTPDEGQNFAEKFLRFFPRSVTLAPNEAQVVKMQLIRTNELKPGEYRSHIYFRAVPKQTALGTIEKPKDSTAIGVKLVPIFGITIPVIIHSGESTMKVNLSDLKLEVLNDTIPRLQFNFHRTGNMSVYGDILVQHISPQGVTTPVGVVKGIAVYTPNALRKFQMNLDQKAKADYRNGTLRITFSSQDTKSEKYTEAELKLQ